MSNTGTIDFSKGGYRGDEVEEDFKPFTTQHMPFWWHFREVLRASDGVSAHWRTSNGSPLLDDGQRVLVALSLLNYAVYTAMAEALAFLSEMQDELRPVGPAGPTSGSGFRLLDGSLSTGTCSTYKQGHPNGSVEWAGGQLFQVRKAWKALYSSLYTSFNALSNIVCVLVGKKPVFRGTLTVRNYTPSAALKLVEGDYASLADPLHRCDRRMEIRHHLDHYWLIWHTISHGKLLFDSDFAKGRLVLRPGVELALAIDAYQRALEDIQGSARDFNLVYQELAVRNGFLDQYLQSQGWQIDYSDYGLPHGGQRPRP